MEKFTTLTSIAIPLPRANIDTDAIIPSREINRVSKTGLGDALFAGWRYLGSEDRTPDPDFPLNQEEYQGAEILLAGENFGCGSSREHAVWALKDWGIRVLIAPSFGAIFEASCIRNGVLPVVLAEDAIAALAGSGALTIDLQKQVVVSGGNPYSFGIPAEAKQMLLEGLDHIDLTLKYRDEIRDFRNADRAIRPWAYL